MKTSALRGFHCHVGSQVFGEGRVSAHQPHNARLFARLKKELGFETKQFDIGGWLWRGYVDSDADAVNIAACIDGLRII